MKRALWIACAVAALGGCAVPVHYEYMKEGASAYERTNSLSECQYQVNLNKVPQQEINGMIRLCMQGKGWRLRQVSN